MSTGRKRTSTNKRKSAPKKKRVWRRDGKLKFNQIPEGGLTTINNVSALPDRIRIKLKWSLCVVLAPGTPFGKATFSGTFIGDPGLGLDSHKVMAYNQWMALYGRYRPFGCAYDISAAYVGGAGSAYLTILPSNDATGPTTFVQADENPRSQYIGHLSLGASWLHRKKGYISTAEVWGVPREMVKLDDQFSTTISTNIGRPWYWHICGVTGDGSTNINIQMRVNFIYYVELYDRGLLAMST